MVIVERMNAMGGVNWGVGNAGIQRFTETDWVVVLGAGETVAQLGRPPDTGWVMAFLAGSEHLDGLDDSAPSDLLWGHMLTSELTVAAGRTGNPIHERERVRFSLFLRLADALVLRDPVSRPLDRA